MTPQKWYEGVPPVEAVLANETQHTRPDGIRLGRITVGDKDGSRYVATDDWSYGEWLSYRHKSDFQPWVGIQRLKVVEGVVVFAIGFTQWETLASMPWANETLYFPVGQNGLPVFYETKLYSGD